MFRRWSRGEYYALTESGYFHDERVELINGGIVQKPAQNEPHAWTVMLLTRQLNMLLASTHLLRVQLPLALGEDSDPEPDVSVLPLSLLSGPMSRPASADLVIEVSDSSLLYDRTVKQAIYARNGIAEYWIVNLIDRQLEVHRSSDPAAGRYVDFSVLLPGQSTNILCKSGATLPIRDILP